MLAMFGKGSAQVYLRLDQDSYAIGDEITGQVVVQGGTVEQKINKIVVEFFLNVVNDGRVYTKQIHRFAVADSFSMQPGEEKTFPLKYQIPLKMLLSSSKASYHFITKLDIQSGKDDSHREVVSILANKPLQNLFAALEQLGFEETAESRSFDGYLQEFAFAPTSDFRDKLEELEFNIIIKEEGLLLLCELDCYAFLGEKEISRKCWIENVLLDDVEALAKHLRQFIEETLQQYSSHIGDKRYLQHHHYQLAGAVGAIAYGLIALELFDDDLIDDFEDESEESEDFFDDDD